jgi:hypothetical protein
VIQDPIDRGGGDAGRGGNVCNPGPARGARAAVRLMFIVVVHTSKTIIICV